MSDSKKPPIAISTSFNTQSESTAGNAPEQSREHFAIAMLGNFSGRQGAGVNTNIDDRHFIAIDRYNYDDVFASMALQLTLCLDSDSNNSVEVAFSSLKDFHPDQLYKNVAVFSQLRDLRARLNNPQTFKQAVEELGGFDQKQTEPLKVAVEPIDEPKPQAQFSEEASGGSFLDSIMQETQNRPSGNDEITNSSTQAEKASQSKVDDFIGSLFTNKRGVKSRDPRQSEMLAAIDEEITLQMRRLLHHPQLQALEATWRAVQFMVKRIATDKSLKLYLLDVSAEEVAADLNVADASQSQLYKQFCDTAMGDIDWSLIVGDYRFGADIDDILTLSQLGFIAQQAGAQFMAAADENLVGCNGFSETANANKWLTTISPAVEAAWAMLRKSPVAKHISLALPRFILREPYGSKTAPVKLFAFEEMSQPPQHDDYLWGNAAFLKAEQMARAFIKSGWSMQYANVKNTDDLPIHYYEDGGRTVVKPCAEILLSETGANKMLAQGLIPLWSFKDADRVHSGDFHSIAD
ncbi:type VI secretion system contractile sheath large subunit [Alteromonadaceae bacterium BrNp21-10]|nr:type VI secretion system contractile sheath large subunit [Alteromonadaceae bacterium BrNp21-10]